MPAGLRTLVPLAALTAWFAVSAAWSTLPDRSWVYANRAFVYTLFALLGLWLAPRTRALALGLAALLGLVAVWALAGKVVPPLYDYGPPGLARLRAPVGLWNQLALLGAFALPLALWRRRLEGTLLAYVWLVAIALTGSRGGAAVAAVVVAVWFVFGEERIAAAAVLVAAAVPALVVAGIAFTLPGVTSDGQSLHVRWHDGLVFGVLLVAGGVAAGLLARITPPRDSRALRRCGAGARRGSPSPHPGRRRAQGRLDVAVVHELGAGDEHERPLHVGGIQLPLGVVEAGLARLRAPRARRDGRRLLPA